MDGTDGDHDHDADGGPWTPDELAGVVDLFGALTRAELRDALGELAFREGRSLADDAAAALVADAVESYHLVAVDPDVAASADEESTAESGSEAATAATESAAAESGPDGDELLLAGPSAFPALPDHAEDLPHILDVPARSVDRGAAGRAVEERLRAEAAQAVAAGDDERAAALLDASYDLEAWAPVDASDARARLDDALGE